MASIKALMMRLFSFPVVTCPGSCYKLQETSVLSCFNEIDKPQFLTVFGNKAFATPDSNTLERVLTTQTDLFWYCFEHYEPILTTQVKLWCTHTNSLLVYIIVLIYSSV